MIATKIPEQFFFINCGRNGGSGVCFLLSFPEYPNDTAEKGNWTLLMEENLYAKTLEFSKPREEKMLW